MASSSTIVLSTSERGSTKGSVESSEARMPRNHSIMKCCMVPERSVDTEASEHRDSSVHNADFSELVTLHWSQVFRTCLRIVRNQHDGEDAAQDSFLRAFSHLHQFQGEAQFSTWLHSIARN